MLSASKVVETHNREVLEQRTRDFDRSEKLKEKYRALKQQHDEIESQMRDLNWQYHQLTGGWFEIAGSGLRKLKVARFASMSSLERTDLARQIEDYIRSRGGECLALEIGGLFGDKIPQLSVFMARYVRADRTGTTRATVYSLRPD